MFRANSNSTDRAKGIGFGAGGFAHDAGPSECCATIARGGWVARERDEKNIIVHFTRNIKSALAQREDERIKSSRFSAEQMNYANVLTSSWSINDSAIRQ